MPKKRRLDFAQLEESLARYLQRSGVATAKEARAVLGISQPAFSRLVARMRDRVLKAGSGPRLRYAYRRGIQGVDAPIPVYEIDESGRALRTAALHPIHPRGFHLDPEGFYDDLPYLFEDLRPSGFLGRLVPRQHPELHLPEDVRAWSADHCLRYLTRCAWDTVGNFILGEEAFRVYLERVPSLSNPVPETDRASHYARLADSVLVGGTPGSSAAGEQPKFLALRATPFTHVLVKFSPAIRDEVSRRIADLLVCEHLALELLRERGVPASASTLIEGEGRVFLEVERFDRVGALGRRGVISLRALDLQFVGRLGRWTETAEALCEQGRIDTDARLRIRWLDLFGSLIANTDMHPANLSFFLKGGAPRELAPVYDMLPMGYHPQQGQLLPYRFKPEAPRPSDAPVWQKVWTAARDYWLRVAADPRISDAFRSIARENGAVLAEMARYQDMLPRES